MMTNMIVGFLISILSTLIFFALDRNFILIKPIPKLTLLFFKIFLEPCVPILRILALAIIASKKAIIANKKNDGYVSKFPIIANSLPDEPRKYLCDLRRMWRDRGYSPQKVKIKTYYFLFRHWWCNSWYELGKRIRRFLPSRWI